MSDLTLRPVTAADADQLLAWRNDEPVRSGAFSQGIVPRRDHVIWLERKLADSGCRMWILERGRVAVGQVRYDVVGTVAEISYSIGPQFRRRGFGVAILQLSGPLACRELGVTALTGLVKEENAASAQAFERADFHLDGYVLAHGHDCRHYVRRCHGDDTTLHLVVAGSRLARPLRG